MKKILFSLIISLIVITGYAENLAKNATATASSIENQNLPPHRAVDGNRTGGRWASARDDQKAWLLIDLGEEKTVGRVNIFWETAAARNYEIQLSNDGENFETVYTVTHGKTKENANLSFIPKIARYVKIKCNTRATQYAYSIYEVEIYSASDNLAFGSTVSVSSSPVNANKPQYIVDGNKSTRWESARTDNEWIKIDLGSIKSISTISILWETAAAKEYTIKLSNDDIEYSEIFTETNGAKGIKDIKFESQDARYILVDCKKRTTQYGYSIWELEVY